MENQILDFAKFAEINHGIPGHYCNLDSHFDSQLCIAASTQPAAEINNEDSNEQLAKEVDAPPPPHPIKRARVRASAGGGKCAMFGGFLCGVTNDREFKDEASRIRAMCMAERLELEARGSTNSSPLLVTEKPVAGKTESLCWAPEGHQLNEVGVGPDGWQLLSMAVDSGAAETVIPHRLVSQHPVRETRASRAGLCYSSATGQPIPNLGEQKLPLVTMEGTLRGMTFQAAPVSKPLGSVKRICGSGHRVVFDDEGSYVQNKVTGEINWLREENGNYMLDAWIVPPSEMPTNDSAGFGRQP